MQPDPAVAAEYRAAGWWGDTTVGDAVASWGRTRSDRDALVADGRNGLRVVQLFSPADNPNYVGFSPRPTPKLIASRKTRGVALALSKGVDRDRAVDESGNQLSVFGRRGARPFNLQEMQKLYLRNGELYTVSDDSPGRARPAAASAAKK